ncbi:MAG: leucyl aminopeptidase [Acidimicrobiales bacterium]
MPGTDDELATVGVPVVVRERAGEDTGANDGSFHLLCRFDGLSGASSSVAASLLPESPDTGWLRRQGFSAKPGQSLVLRTAAGGPSVVLLGLGDARTFDRDDGKGTERWRQAAASLVRAAGEGGSAALVLPYDPLGSDALAVGAAVAEGAVLAAYRFDTYRSTPRPPAIERLLVVWGGTQPNDRASVLAARLAEGVRRGTAAAAAAVFARDLVNTPASDLTPARFAARVSDALAGRPGTAVEVWDEERIAAERLGGLLAVSRGSGEPPRLVRAAYVPSGGMPGSEGPAREDAQRHIVLVGKGITFDSGGLSLKTAEGMTTMKTDMSGAAIVMAVVAACSDLEVAVRVTALAPLAENMPGGRATKPGDVFTARNGATVEVLNTDAEGRLVLADALSLAVEMEPDAVVDVATLTGAARAALGAGVAPILGNDDELVEAVRAAGARAGERLWPLPLPDDYGEHIESDVADMKNIGRQGEAGVIAAALLLERFVGRVPWAHLDIAGTGRSAEAAGYLSKGGTAFGVRTLLDFLSHHGGPDHPGESRQS